VSTEEQSGSRRAALRTRLQRTPPGYRHSLGRTLVIYVGLMVTILIAALDQTIVATALPRVVADIGGLSSYSWVFGAYLLFQTVTVPIYGKLGDIHGRRRMLMIAISIFLTGSVLCSLAQNMTELVAFRAVQGIGAGGMIPLVVATVGDLVPPRERGRYQGVFGSAWAVASIVGPAVGGLIVDHMTWRWIFYVNVPIGTLALAVVAVTMPRPAFRREHSLDYLGAALLAAGTGLLLLGLLWGGRSYPWSSPRVVGSLAASVVLLCAFGLQERRARETVLPLEVLRNRPVAAGAICMTMVAMCQFGTISFMPLFFQEVIGSSATSSGIVLTPLLLGSVVASILSGQWISRWGHTRPNVLVAPLVLGAGMALLWRISVHTTPSDATHAMILAGVGIGAMMPVFVIVAQNAVPAETIGATTAFMQFARSIGTTLGTTMFGVIVNQGLPAAVRAGTPGDVRLSPTERVQLTSALHPAFLFATALAACVWVVAFWGVKGGPLRRSFDEPPASATEWAQPIGPAAPAEP
jgi:EmrB/QacA subfamily drug resistance transporter